MTQSPHSTTQPADAGAITLPASVSRRSLLRLALAGAGIAATGPVLARTGLLGTGGVVQQGAISGVISGTAPMTGPMVTKFERELLIPPVIQPTQTRTETVLGKPAQVAYYDITQKVGSTDLLPAPFPRTEIWGYNGTYPGPTFRQTTGGTYTVVRQTNALPGGRGTSTHLHGSPTQPAHDGHPDDQTYPAGVTPVPTSEFDGAPSYLPTHVYRYPNTQETRTLWYHDHGMHNTAQNVYKGLVGMFIQDPDAARTAKFSLDKLPGGKYDVPLLIGDMQFNADGTVAFDDKGHDSLWGNVILVNGRAWPKLTVDRTRYRFRMLVADMSRGYNFKLSNGMPFTVIGTDAGLLSEPVTVSEFRHGMAERYDVVIDFSNVPVGQKITLLNTAADGDVGQVMQFVASGPKVASSPVPPRLNDYVFGAEAAEVVNPDNPRYFEFNRSGGLWTINGLPWTGVVAAAPKVGTVEKWILKNGGGGWFHPVHIHLVDFHIISRNGAPPFAYEKGWKDVVYIGPGETVELVMRFNAAAQIDPAKPVVGKYVMHCHNLIHEDHDMMTQFSTDPGDAPTGTSVTATAAAMDMGKQPSMMVQWTLNA